MKRILGALVISASCLVAVPPGALADVMRESTGARRESLDKMELQAFPAVWDGLAAWSGGDPLKAAELSGKPALIVNWASWNAGSVRGLAMAQKVADKYSAKGLIVVGIHHANGWETAADAAKAKGITFRLAHDKDGAYRKALSIDHEPEYYVIDRAGHLRYAAVSAGSVDEAVEEVVTETAAQAGDVPKIKADREAAATAQGKRTTAIRTDFELQSLPPVPPGYLPPGENAYKDVKWPSMEKELGKTWGLLDNDGKALEPKSAFQPIVWYPKRPETTGRVQVIYFWHPDLNITYSGVMNSMDQLQEQHQRDIAITGALIGLKVLKGENNNGSQNTDEETFEKLKKKYDNFVSNRKYSHALGVDIAMTCLAGLNAQNGGQKFPVPGAMIVSSDGTIRWMGWTYDNLGRMTADFRAALDKAIENDPGVRARRAADRAYIENRKR